MTRDHLQIGVHRDEQIEVVEAALDAVREEFDAEDAPNTDALASVCAAYVGRDEPLWNEGETA